MIQFTSFSYAYFSGNDFSKFELTFSFTREILQQPQKILNFLIFPNLTSFNRDKCHSKNGGLLMTWLLLVVEIFEIFLSPLFFPTWTFSMNDEKTWVFYFFQTFCHSKEEEVTRLMIQLLEISYDYFPISGDSKFSFERYDSSNQDQNFFNFCISQIWCQLRETNKDRVMIGCKCRDPSLFSK